MATSKIGVLLCVVAVALATVPAGASTLTTGEFEVTFIGTAPAGSVQRIEAAGAAVLGVSRSGGLAIRAPLGISARIEALPGVDSVVPLPAVSSSPVPDGAEGVGTLYLVRFDPDAGPGILSGLSGVEVFSASDGAALVSVAPGALGLLESVDGVAAIEQYVMRALRNESAGAIIGADAAEVAGYDGTGQIIAVADSGLGTGTAATAHRDIPAGRIIAIDDWPAPDAPGCWDAIPDGAQDVDAGHGTHVTGSAVSDGDGSGVGRGTAPGASLLFQAVEDYLDVTADCGDTDGYYLVGLPADSYDLLADAYDQGARVHSDSWGVDDAGAYNADSSAFDAFVWDHPDMAVVVAAGNAGSASGTVGSPATAKNVIAVGASESVRPGGHPCDDSGGVSPFTGCFGDGSTNDTGTAADDTDQVAGFSSRGPTVDGRIKPDVVAPGSWILSTYSDMYQEGYDGAPNPRTGQYQWTGFGYPYDAHYKYMSGTSMATPLVAGAAALVREFFADAGHEASAALVKAMLVNSAVDLADEDNDGDSSNEFPIPNIHEGWGRVDVAEALDGDRLWADSGALETGLDARYRYSAPGGSPLRITVVWADFPVAAGSTSTLVNDLDLRVTAPNGTVYRGNVFGGGWSATGGSFDRVNNVENVYIQSAAAGTWTFEVEGYDVLFGPQPFALVVDGATASVPTAPSVIAVNPVDGQVVAGDVEIEAAAVDDDEVVSVRFTAAGVVLGIDTDGSDGWTMPWDVSALSDRSVTVSLRATDSDGQTATSSIQVDVDNPAPEVTVTRPAAGATVAGTVDVIADARYATSVEFFADGDSIGVDSSSADGWRIGWNTVGRPEGETEVSAVASGIGGADDTATVVVTIDNLAVGGTFTDDDDSVHQADIEALAAAGITIGCNPPDSDRFCPGDPMTRGQLAAFLTRALALSAPSDDTFLDDDESVFETDIEAIAAAGVTIGCNPPEFDRFCPDDPVTRGQMAAFLTRARNYPPEPGDRFADDNVSVFESDIEAIAAAGVTFGCNPPFNDRYCPEATVTRAQMASFIVRVLGLKAITP